MPIIDILDADIPDAGGDLGQISVDPLLAQIASIKDRNGGYLIHHWIDPEPSMHVVKGSQLVVSDSFHKTCTWQTLAAGAPVAVTTDFNGKATFYNPGGVVGLMPAGATDGNLPSLTAWSLTAVVEVDPGATANAQVFGIGQGPALAAGQLYPALEIELSGALSPRLLVREGGTNAIRAASITIPELRNQRVIVTVSFDTTSGFKFFVGGRHVGITSAVDVRPLTHPTSTYLSNRAGLFNLVGRAGSGFRHGGALGAAENAGALALFTEGLAAYYGVPAF